MKRRLEGSVVVVTGATSGAGRATAEAFAQQRARLVLVARSGAALADVVVACERAGSTAMAVPTDIADPVAVDHVVRAAVEAFGRIDTWVDMAATLLAGPVTACPPNDIERVVATNVAGAVLCSRAALLQFEAQGHGVLINTSSVLGTVPNPLVPVYTASKFAIHGFTRSLQTYYRRASPIRVCEVMPGPLDTPMFEHAANHTGRVIRAIPPACAPERAAAAVVRSARRPRRLRMVGHMGRLVWVGLHVVPVFTQWAVARYSARMLLTSRPLDPTSGAAFEPSPESRTHGGWRWWALRRGLGRSIGRALARGVEPG